KTPPVLLTARLRSKTGQVWATCPVLKDHSGAGSARLSPEEGHAMVADGYRLLAVAGGVARMPAFQRHGERLLLHVVGKTLHRRVDGLVGLVEEMDAIADLQTGVLTHRVNGAHQVTRIAFLLQLGRDSYVYRYSYAL